MAAAFSSAGAKVNKTGTGGPDQIVVAPPATHATGDLFVLQLVSWTNAVPPASVTTPSGWTLLGSSVDWGFAGRYQSWLFSRVAASSSEASVTVAIESNSRAEAQIYRFIGADTTTPIDAAAVFGAENAGTSLPTPAITTTTANALIVYAGIDSSDTDWGTPPAGSVENVDSGNFGGIGRLYIASKTRATAGTEAASSWARPAGGGGCVIATLALRGGAPAGAAFVPQIMIVG